MPRADIPDLPTLMAYVDHYATNTPNAIAAQDFGSPGLTYRELVAVVRAIQDDLLSAGVRPGDVVGTMAPPSVDHWTTFLAVADMGAVWLGLNPRYRLSEWRDIFAVATPRALFARDVIGERRYDADVNALIDEFDVMRLPFASSAVHVARHGNSAVDVTEADPADPCLLVFTSGSTGEPKGVLLRQSGLVACGRTQAHHYGAPGGVALNPLPINHVGAIVDVGTTSLVVGGTQVFLDDFVPATFVEALVRSKATLLGGVPAMLLYLIATPEFWSADLSSVQRILWSGGAMPRSGAEILYELQRPMHNFYGMTETTGSFTFTDPDADLDQLVTTVGRPDADWVVRIADPVTGAAAPTGTVGEIQVRGPGVLHSYFGDPDATAAAFTADGFFRTADLGVRHQDGTISLAGRLREVYKSGGYNVFPRQVEEALEAVPGVAMATVVPVPDPLLGEVGMAFLTMMPGTQLDEDAIRSELKTTLASYKVPKRFMLLDEPPLLPTGKIDRKALAVLAAQETHHD